MLFKLLLTIFGAALNFLTSLLPSWEPIDFNAGAEAIVAFLPAEVGTFFRWMNYYTPLREALLLAVTGAGIWLAVLTYRVVVDVLTKLHILGGSA